MWLHHIWVFLLFSNGYRSERIDHYNPHSDPLLHQRQYVLPLHTSQVLKPRPYESNGKFDYFEIGVRQVAWQMVADKEHKLDRTYVFAYGDARDFGTGSFQYIGPTIEAQVGRPTRVKWVNQLTHSDGKYRKHIMDCVDNNINWASPTRNARKEGNNDIYDGPVPIVAHVHGLITTEENNGYPEAWYIAQDCTNCEGYASSGRLYEHFRDKSSSDWNQGAAVYDYANDQPPGHLWYGDNTHGLTRCNRMAGMTGNYFLRGPEHHGEVESLRHVPELILTLSDVRLTNKGQLYYPKVWSCIGLVVLWLLCSVGCGCQLWLTAVLPQGIVVHSALYVVVIM